MNNTIYKGSNNKQRLKKDYINAIPKPCWELNYCPYGSLVKVFPTLEKSEYSIDLDTFKDLLRLVFLWNHLQNNDGCEPTKEVFCSIIQSKDLEIDIFMFMIVSKIIELLKNKPPLIALKENINALRFRWGIKDGEIHSIIESCEKYNLEVKSYVKTEMLLLSKLGLVLRMEPNDDKYYYELKTDFIIF